MSHHVLFKVSLGKIVIREALEITLDSGSLNLDVGLQLSSAWHTNCSIDHSMIHSFEYDCIYISFF